jgi:hypothetical protein
MDQIDDEEYKKRNWGLDGDVVFDGHLYRNRQGEILPGHPKREIILQEYLDILNKEL